MLLCAEQKMPIIFRGRKVVISDKVANAHYHMCNMPVNATEVGMNIGYYLNGQEDNLDEKLKIFSDKKLTEIVEAGIKGEFVDLFGEKAWDDIRG